MIRLELLTLCAFLLVTKTLMAREAEDTSLKRRVVSVLAKFLERHKLRQNSSEFVKNGTEYVIFNCTSPSYLNEAHRPIGLRDTELNRHKIGLTSKANGTEALCDLRTNIWKTKTSKLLTYDPGFRRIGQIPNDKELARLLRLDVSKLDADLAAQLNNQSLVASVLKTYHHPRFY